MTMGKWLLTTFTLSAILCASGTAWAAELTAQQIRAVAKEAYIYGYPLVDNYRVMVALSVDEENPAFQAHFNQIRNKDRLFTSADSIPADNEAPLVDAAMLTSTLTLDLRAEPVVIVVPPVEKGRYFSVQLIDLLTRNFDYLGSRTTGNDGGNFLIAGPNWKGETPPGIDKVLRSKSELALALFRTQLFGVDDLASAQQVQAGYQVEPLSTFLGVATPPPAPTINFFQPLSAAQERTSLEFFNELAFLLQFCPADSGEASLRQKFAEIGVVPGRPFGVAFMSPGIQAALAAGMADGQRAIDERRAQLKASGDFGGTGQDLLDEFTQRAAGAQAGTYGNSSPEEFSIPLAVDTGGHVLNGDNNRYTLTFGPGMLPPVRGLWSLSMYSLPDQRLVTNPLNRFVINSPMLPQMQHGADGGLTIYIQQQAPGGEQDTNWLPAPDGPFLLILRLYWPEQAVLDNAWQAPGVVQVE
jgi:hypothetical protein